MLLDVSDGSIAERIGEVHHRRGGRHAVQQRVRQVRTNVGMGNRHIRMVAPRNP